MVRVTGRGGASWATGRSVVRAGVGLFCLVAFLLGAAAISLTMAPQDFQVRVWAQPVWDAGRTAGLRVAAVDPEVERFYRGVAFHVWLETPRGRVELGRFTEPGRARSLTAAVPREPGRLTLVVRASLGERRAEAREHVEVVPPGPRPWPDGPLRPIPHTPGSVVMVPVGGDMVPELGNRVSVLVIDRDGRIMAGVRVHLSAKKAALSRPLPEVVEIGPNGIGRFTITSGFKEAVLSAWVEGPGPVTDVVLHGRAVPLVARLPGGPLPALGEVLRVEVDAITGTRTTHVDLYQGERWVASASGHGEHVVLDLPTSGLSPGVPARVEAFQGPVPPGQARFTLWLLPGASPGDAVRRLLGWMAAHHPGSLPSRLDLPGLDRAGTTELAGFLLDTLARPEFDPPLLDAGQRARSRARREAMERMRAHVNLALWVMAVALLVGLVAWITRGRTGQRRMYEEVVVELDDAPPTMERVRGVWAVVALVTILALALAGMLLLMDNLRWGLD